MAEDKDEIFVNEHIMFEKYRKCDIM